MFSLLIIYQNVRPSDAHHKIFFDFVLCKAVSTHTKNFLQNSSIIKEFLFH